MSSRGTLYRASLESEPSSEVVLDALDAVADATLVLFPVVDGAVQEQ
jgi:hypothetical protein